MPQKQKDTRWNCPTSVRFFRCITACAVLSKLVLLVADVFGLSRVKRQVADGSDQAVNAAGDVTEDKISPGTRGVPSGFKEEWLMIRLPIQPRKKVKRKRATLLSMVISP